MTAIGNEQHRILVCLHTLDGEYGKVTDVAKGVPCVLGEAGMELDLNATEMDGFRSSVGTTGQDTLRIKAK